MVLRAKSKFYKMKPNKLLLYIPKELSNDSQWPFTDPNEEVTIIVLPQMREIKVLAAPKKKGEHD